MILWTEDVLFHLILSLNVFALVCNYFFLDLSEERISKGTKI